MLGTITKKADIKTQPGARTPTGWLLTVTSAMFLCLLTIFLVKTLWIASDYLGPDNDDAMRLVIVRDFLAGQGWFDHMQYRLGIEPGTLMHWSRLIDAPIAALITAAGFFSAKTETAEAVALFIWPVGLTFPLIFFAALGGYRLGGKQSAVIAAALTAIHAYITQRFAPGAIDHHNVQMVLVAALAASLLDPRHQTGSGAAAGLAAAIALAIGAETTPLIAAAAIAVALLWAFNGKPFAGFASIFSLSFAGFTAIAYIATISPEHYTETACDTLSAGYLYLALWGGLALTACTRLVTSRPFATRMGALAAIGIAAGVLAYFVMPQCLGDPYYNLDPLLKDIWLSTVIEAQSFLMQFHRDPSVIGGHYAPGLLALMVCVVNIARNNKRQQHFVLAVLIGMAWIVTLLQLRGSIFANLISALPLGFAIASLRTAARTEGAAKSSGLAFALFAVASMPASWFLAGNVAFPNGTENDPKATETSGGNTCWQKQNFVALSSLPTGTIAAISSAGAPILRYTRHRVLSAPYHRDQAGMLAVLEAGLAQPEDAIKHLKGAGADYLVVCENGAKEMQLAHRATDGLFAQIQAGNIPGRLRLLSGKWDSRLKVYSISAQ